MDEKVSFDDAVNSIVDWCDAVKEGIKLCPCSFGSHIGYTYEFIRQDVFAAIREIKSLLGEKTHGARIVIPEIDVEASKYRLARDNDGFYFVVYKNPIYCSYPEREDIDGFKTHMPPIRTKLKDSTEEVEACFNTLDTLPISQTVAENIVKVMKNVNKQAGVQQVSVDIQKNDTSEEGNIGIISSRDEDEGSGLWRPGN